ncbi:MAG TPA: SDR family NAD(P)-dependent oxidoreductase, partial [Candidatus Binataceae bacterium]|nr:SDR family NAD(P)-dependent oxidoreductase [Candidatus Binataceae bacterium]
HRASEILMDRGERRIGIDLRRVFIAERSEAQHHAVETAEFLRRARNYVYGAAKGGLHTFAQGLRGRMARAGVHVMTVKLGTVDTRMTWGREGTLLTVSPERAASAIYAAYQRKAEVVYVPWFWRPIMGVVKLIPERIFKRTSF